MSPVELLAAQVDAMAVEEATAIASTGAAVLVAIGASVGGETATGVAFKNTRGMLGLEFMLFTAVDVAVRGGNLHPCPICDPSFERLRRVHAILSEANWPAIEATNKLAAAAPAGST